MYSGWCNWYLVCYKGLETKNDYDDYHLNCDDYVANNGDYEDDDIDEGGGEDEPQHYQHNRHTSNHSIPVIILILGSLSSS